jgi:PAS domain S-box-containing protein
MISNHWTRTHEPTERELRLLDVLARQAADLIERKQAEEALKESEMRLQTTLNASRMGSWDLDLQTGAVIWNKQQYKLLGLDWASLKDVPLTPDRLFRYIHPEDSSRAEKRLQAAREGKGDYEDSFRIVRANDGEIRWMARYGRKTKARDGSYSHLSGVMYDITEQKNLERQKDEFIGIASHELKTPVTGITIYAELINGIFREKGDEEHVELSEKLILEINRLVKLINDLLDTTRITKGHLPLNLEEFDLDALIEEIMGSLKFSSSDHQIIFHPPQPLKVRADRNRIHQVITNLLSNAIKYSPDSREVHVMTETTEEGVKVSVKDTGIGIPEELQPKIFNGFSRVSFPHNFPGVGLGLYISSEIIRRHGGRICVESELDKGSVFYFVLPHQIVAEADKTAPVR